MELVLVFLVVCRSMPNTITMLARVDKFSAGGKNSRENARRLETRDADLKFKLPRRRAACIASRARSSSTLPNMYNAQQDWHYFLAETGRYRFSRFSRREGRDRCSIWQDLTAVFCGYDVNPCTLRPFAHHVTRISSWNIRNTCWKFPDPV